ncbi:MAG: Holliday junction DNA helicase RuvB, partial [uncultured bacterium]
LSEEKDTLEDVYEPFLIQQGLMHRTPRGRVATKNAFDYMGVKNPVKVGQSELF